MKKLLCIFFSCLFIFTLLCSVHLTVTAATIPEKIFDSTSVVDDIKSMYMDYETEFPYDPTDEEIYLINFIEFGYDEMAAQNSDVFGLYIYVYNPSGKELFGEMNKIQMATKWKADGNGELKATDFRKYNLTLLDINENKTLAKYKISSPDKKLVYINSDRSRRYDISGIELRNNTFEAEDYTVATTFVYSGYAKGLSLESKDRSTLACYCEEFLTLTVEAHQVSYLTGNSHLGVGYSNQVNSVYFSIPEDIIDKYGSLYSVKYEYYHYYTYPMIFTDNKESYNTLMSDRGKIADDDWKYHLRIVDYVVSGPMVGPAVKVYKWYYGKTPGFLSNTSVKYADRQAWLTSVFYKSGGWDYKDVLITESELLKYLRNYDKSYFTGKNVLGYSSDLFNLQKSKCHVVNTSYVNDVFSLKGYNSNHIWLERWFDFGIFSDSKDYDDIKNKKYIEEIETSSIFSSSDFSKNYLVDDIYKSEFSNFYSEAKANNENVYLLRYAVADDYYVNDDVEGVDIDGDFLMASSNVYVDFDIIQFEFKNKLGKTTVIPVVSNPTSGASAIINTDPNRDFGDVVDDVATIIQNGINGVNSTFEAIKKYFGIICIVILATVVTVIIIRILSKNKSKHNNSNSKNKVRKKPYRRKGRRKY